MWPNRQMWPDLQIWPNRQVWPDLKDSPLPCLQEPPYVPTVLRTGLWLIHFRVVQKNPSLFGFFPNSEGVRYLDV